MTSPAAGRPAEDDFHLRVLIDSMVRAGHSEREVVAAVALATGHRPAARQSRKSLFSVLRRLTG
jgi:flagellar biosynthesis/type III secretory pathway ATPase